MATLKEYFDADFNYALSVHAPIMLRTDSKQLEIIARVHLDFNSNTKYVSYFIPICTDLLQYCLALITNLNTALSIADSVAVQSKLPGEALMSSEDLKFSGRVFIYAESELTDEEQALLKESTQQVGLSVQFRGPKFAKERSAIEKPLAFISHDSQDKEEIARPIATGLQKLMCPVWYDEFSLKVGDSLRDNIERGLKECKRCILILSPYFLSNTGWTKVEFDSIFTRQILERTSLVLPVWHGVTARQVYEYSPSLADKVGVRSSLGIEEVCRQIHRAIMSNR